MTSTVKYEMPPADRAEFDQSMAAERDRIEALVAQFPLPSATCPDWCEEPSGHRWSDLDSDDVNIVSRGHGRTFGAWFVWMTESVTRDGTVTVSAPGILGDDDLDLTDPAQVLADLTDAVALYRQVVAPVSPRGDTAAQVLAEQDAVAEDAQ